MKNLLVLCVLAAFGATMVGCHADADVKSPDSDTAYKKETTTVRTPDGSSRTTTEVHTNP
jgi:hypothetical protein